MTVTNSELYSSIFKRRSIRKFDMVPLPQDKLLKIKEFAGGVHPLVSDIKYEFEYLSTNDVKNLLPIKAPHYICLYSDKKDNYLMNAGYLLQQIDLFLSTNNIASCWLGMAKPNSEVPAQKNGLEFVIMLAFGNTEEVVHRVSTSEFRRYRLDEITTIKGAEQLFEPVRLAPSASNTQSWFFSGDTKEITVSRKKLNIIKAQLYGKMNQIDIGIALCHLWLSIDHQGKTSTLDFKKGDAPSGYEFMVKVKVD